MHAREVWKRGTRHKGQFKPVQSTVEELYHETDRVSPLGANVYT